MKTKILILAGGKGKRMGRERPKVLCELYGRPMILNLVENLSKVKAPIGFVVGHQSAVVQETLGRKFSYYLQEEQLGTGHAVLAAKEALRKEGVEHLIVLYGDHPFVQGESVQKLFKLKEKSSSPICMMTTVVEDFSSWRKLFFYWGRILRDKNGKLQAIREYKDCLPSERFIRELNPGMYCFETRWLWGSIEKIQNKNTQKEYYLTDLIEMAICEGYEIPTLFIDPRESLGINSFDELEMVQEIWR